MASNLFQMLSRCSYSWKTTRFVTGKCLRCASTTAQKTNFSVEMGDAAKSPVTPPLSSLIPPLTSLLGGDKNKEEKRDDQQQHLDADDETTAKIKEQILEASLEFVPRLGWSRATITAGATSIGYPGVVHGLFKSDGFDLVNYFYQSCNMKLVDIMQAHLKTNPQVGPPSAGRERDLVMMGIKERLSMIIPYIEKWPEALAIMVLPSNMSTSLANLLTLADDICYYAGDRSFDMNWYTKRLGVASIYRFTETFMIQDSSEGYRETWRFLGDRLGEFRQLHTFLHDTDQVLNQGVHFGKGIFTTARNMLGLH